VFSLPVLKHHVILSFLFQKFSFLFELSHINNTREPCNPNYAGAEIRRILVWSQSEPIVCETLSWKYPIQKQTGVVQGVVPDYNPPHSKKKKKRKDFIVINPYMRTMNLEQIHPSLYSHFPSPSSLYSPWHKPNLIFFTTQSTHR
jgi:hypothetical protein